MPMSCAKILVSSEYKSDKSPEPEVSLPTVVKPAKEDDSNDESEQLPKLPPKPSKFNHTEESDTIAIDQDGNLIYKKPTE